MEGSLLWKIRKGVGYLESFLLIPLQLPGHSTTTITQSSPFWTSSSSLSGVQNDSRSFPDLSRVKDISCFERQLQACKQYSKNMLLDIGGSWGPGFSQSAEIWPLLSPLASFWKDEQMWRHECLLRDSGGVPAFWPGTLPSVLFSILLLWGIV